MNHKVIAQTEPLYYAASYDMGSVIRLLLKSEARENIDKQGGRRQSTPLYIACWRGNTNAAMLLVEAGANPFIIDSSGYTSRELAESRGMHDVVALMDKIWKHGDI
jgi:ankyrin repeat protein